MSNQTTGLLTDQNIVENLCPNFLSLREKKETFEKDSLVYYKNTEIIDGKPQLIVSIGRIKNTAMSSASQSAMAISQEFGLAPDKNTKDFILLRQRLVLDVALADNPNFVAVVGQPLKVNGTEWELTEEMNITGDGEAYITEDKQSRIKYNRLDASGNVIYRKMVMAPKGTKNNTVIPFASKRPVQNTTSIGALASMIAAASTTETAQIEE